MVTPALVTDVAVASSDERLWGTGPLVHFGVGNGLAAVLRGDADCFNGHRRQTGLGTVLRSDADCFKGHSRDTPSSTNASVDGADVVVSAAAARAGDVTMYTTLHSLLS